MEDELRMCLFEIFDWNHMAKKWCLIALRLLYWRFGFGISNRSFPEKQTLCRFFLELPRPRHSI